MQKLLATLAKCATVAPPLMTLLLVFLGGVILSASPCMLAALTGRLTGDVGPDWLVLLGLVLMTMGAQLTGIVRLPLSQVSGFTAAFLASRAARWGGRLHRVFGAVLVAIGAWVLVPALRTVLGV